MARIARDQEPGNCREDETMNVTCPNCATVYRVDPVKVPEAGVRARCALCNPLLALPFCWQRCLQHCPRVDWSRGGFMTG